MIVAEVIFRHELQHPLGKEGLFPVVADGSKRFTDTLTVERSGKVSQMALGPERTKAQCAALAGKEKRNGHKFLMRLRKCRFHDRA